MDHAGGSERDLPLELSSDWIINMDEVLFDITKPIGAGGFAQVFRGRYKGQDVAIKVIHQSLMDTPEKYVVSWAFRGSPFVLATPPYRLLGDLSPS